jgi:hypothetical protein
MLKISILDTPKYRRLVIEGKLIAPWAAELKNQWRKATADLNRRELVVDVKGLAARQRRRKLGPVVSESFEIDLALVDSCWVAEPNSESRVAVHDDCRPSVLWSRAARFYAGVSRSRSGSLGNFAS